MKKLLQGMPCWQNYSTDSENTNRRENDASQASITLNIDVINLNENAAYSAVRSRANL